MSLSPLQKSKRPLDMDAGTLDTPVHVLSETLFRLSVEESSTPKTTRKTQRSKGAARKVLFHPEAQTLSHPESTIPVSKHASFPSWTEREELALIHFILLYTEGGSWSSRSGKGDRFWEQAGTFIQKKVNSSYCRTGQACKLRVFGRLSHQFSSPAAAEIFYHQRLSERPRSPHMLSTVQESVGEASSSASHRTHPMLLPVNRTDTIIDVCENALSALDPVEQLDILSKMFSRVAEKGYSVGRIPVDFLRLAAEGMQNLHYSGRSNTIYHLIKAVGTKRADGSDTLLPTKRMPMGLIEYTASFFTASSLQEISCPPDYRAWLQTMYVLFGSKFTKIFCGPMWSYAPIMQSQLGDTDSMHMSPQKALVNVPAIGERTIRRDIAGGEFTTGSEIQLSMLVKATETDPNAWWWIKGDGVDVVKGVGESMKGEWWGDVDLNDGSLGLMYQDYKDRLDSAAKIGLGENPTEDLVSAAESVKNYLTFLHNELVKTNKQYEEKLGVANTAEKVMFALLCDIDTLKKLNERARTLLSEILEAQDLHQKPECQRFHANLGHKISRIRMTLTDVVKGVFRFKRTPSTHMFLLMVSSEHRNRKPYAVPVQLLPYAGLSECDIRRMVIRLVQEMHRLKMNVAGFVSNGEFNYLRSRGYTRVISVLQIRADVRKKYNRIKLQRLLDMLTPNECSDGTIQGRIPNPAVPYEVLLEVRDRLKDGDSLTQIVDLLRTRTVPAGYVPYPWKPGHSEGLHEKLKSVIAQFEFQYIIRMWELKGVNFRCHLYVPEVLPETGEVFCEREDEAHVLKRIANHTRCGGPDDLQLERYVEALHDPASGLTKPVLTGSRKQSVVDAERFFSPELAEFMKSKGYMYEAKYITCIFNWRRSCDERGLSELQRCHYNYDLLNLILDELMPWHTKTYDFSLLEVNRPTDKILGWSRETLVAVTCNIEGREWRRCQSQERGAEHPRASTTDDVECMFSVMRDIIGRNFTTKQIKFGFRKVCSEFKKRLDPDLPYYYHTSAHTRYSEGQLPEFNEMSKKQRRKHKRVPRREQPSAFTLRRANLPVHGSISLRTEFHNHPINLPPPPTIPSYLSEHSYF